jgi:multidrug resistance efflux pump
MNEYMEAENRLRKGEEELRNWQQDYRMWQINQWSNERAIWLKNMTTALNRYVDALNTEMVVRQAQRQKELADAQARTAYSRSKLGDSIANSYYASQEAEQTKRVVNAGGLIGRIAYFMGR